MAWRKLDIQRLVGLWIQFCRPTFRWWHSWYFLVIWIWRGRNKFYHYHQFRARRKLDLNSTRISWHVSKLTWLECNNSWRRTNQLVTKKPLQKWSIKGELCQGWKTDTADQKSKPKKNIRAKTDIFSWVWLCCSIGLDARVLNNADSGRSWWVDCWTFYQ